MAPGEMGSSVGFEQFALIEHPVRELEKLTTEIQSGQASII